MAVKHARGSAFSGAIESATFIPGGPHLISDWNRMIFFERGKISGEKDSLEDINSQ
jgi:hypothetical protein